VFSVGPTNGWSGFTIGGPANTAFALAQDDNSLWTVNLANGTASQVRSSVSSSVVTALAALPVPPGPPPGIPTVSINDVTVKECSGMSVDAVFTVTLSVPSSQTVTVQVQSLDGTALSPQEYQPVCLTTLTFNPPETTQTVTVHVYDNQLMGGVETFFLVLSNPTNATIAKGQGIGTITNHPIVTPPVNQLLVQEWYVDFLGRLPDAGSQAYWQGLLDAGVARGFVVQSIMNSPEFLIKQVEDLYAQLLGRPADPVGLANAVAALAGGMTPFQLEASILASPEYLADHGGTYTGFLQGVYSDVLGRPIDLPGLAFWSTARVFGSGRALVASGILSSTEAVQDLVNVHYRHILKRAPDPQGLSFWVTSIQDSPRNPFTQMDLTLAVSLDDKSLESSLVNLGFVAKVYHDLLKRPDPYADMHGLLYWVGRLNIDLSRDQVAFAIEVDNGHEFLKHYIADLVNQLTPAHITLDPNSPAVQNLLTSSPTLDQVRAQIFESGPNTMTPFQYAPNPTFDSAWLSQLIPDAIGRGFGTALSAGGFDEDNFELQNVMNAANHLPPPEPTTTVDDVLFGNADQTGIYMNDSAISEGGFALEHLAFLAPSLERTYLGAGITPDPQEIVTNLHFGIQHFMFTSSESTIAFSDAKNDYTFFCNGGGDPTAGVGLHDDGEKEFIANVVGTSAYYPKP
jgi:hypothetical protein